MAQNRAWGHMNQHFWLMLETVRHKPAQKKDCPQLPYTCIPAAAEFNEYFDRYKDVICQPCREKAAHQAEMRLRDTHGRSMTDRKDCKYLQRTLDQIKEPCTCPKDSEIIEGPRPFTRTMNS